MRNNLENESEIQIYRKMLSRKMKTIQSIGTFNQTPQNFDCSVVCRRDTFFNNPFSLEQKQKQTVSLSNLSKISRIPSQANDTQKNKIMYQSRLSQIKASQIHNKSMEKGSNTKSIQKHVLKPTNTPNFGKFDLAKMNMSPLPTEKQANRNQKLLKQSQKKETLQLKMKPYHLQSCSKNNRIQSSQISSKLDQLDFGCQLHIAQNQNQKQNRDSNKYLQDLNKRQTSPGKTLLSQSQSEHSELRQYNKIIHRCNCQQTLKQFMQQTNSKMSQMTQRLAYLENQNYRLKKLENKFDQSQNIILNFKQKIENMQSQNDMLKQSNLSRQAQKQELQKMLKQILFKRQKQKLHNSSQNSKQNTFRQQQQNKMPQKSYEISQNSSTYKDQKLRQQFQNQYFQTKAREIVRKKDDRRFRKGIQPLGTKIANGSSIQKLGRVQSQSDSKMKVQNLLSKLHIKIQRN